MMNTNRDDSLDRALRRLSAPDDTDPSPDCLDPETLAAWVEGRLDRTATRAAEEHAADCARCQVLLAAMARAAGDVGPEAREPRRRALWHMLPWLGPLTAATATAIVWLAVRPASDVEIAPAPASVPQQTGAIAEKDAQDRLPAADPRSDAPPASPERAPSESAPARELRRFRAGSADAQRQERDAKPLEKEGPSARPLSDDARGGRPAVPPPSTLPSLPAEPLPTGAAARAAPAPPPSPKAAAESQTPFAAERRAAAEDALLPPPVIRTPDPNVLWRIMAGTSVQRSIDGGATWTAQEIDATARLLGGAAPSAVVCWIVGARGAVFLSADGRTWTRVAFPHEIDLVGVTAASASAATVRSRDGRAFATTDGGRTWVEQK